MKVKSLFVVMFVLFFQLPAQDAGDVATTEQTEEQSASEMDTAVSEQDEKEQLSMIYYLSDKNEMRGISSWFDTVYAGFVNPRAYTDYLVRINKFNPAEVTTKLAEATKRWPDVFTPEHWAYTELGAFMEFMRTKGFDSVSEKANEMLVEAANFDKAGNFDKALTALDLTTALVDGVLLFNNKNSGALACKAKIDDQRIKVKQSLKKYYTSDFHEKNAGKIVFSKNLLKTGGTESSSIVSSFTDNDSILAMAYLNSRLMDVEKDKGMYMVLYFVDDKSMNGMGASGNVVPARIEDTFFSFPILVGPNDTDMMLPSQIIGKLAEEVSAGKHTIKIQLTTFGLAYDQKILAEGSFNLDILDTAKLKTRAEEHRKAMVAKARIPAAVITSASLETDMKALMPQNFTEAITCLRATVAEGGWNVVKDEWDIPKYRYIRGFVAFKVNRTGKVYYRGIAIMQAYSNGDYSKKSTIYDPTAPYDLYEMLAENVNK